MATTRPYLLVYKGKRHIIEAAGAAAAVHHVVGMDVTELRAARAAEVSAWIREGNHIPIAGAKAEEKPADDVPIEADRTPWSPSDGQRAALADWLLADMTEAKGKTGTKQDVDDLTAAIGQLVEEGQLSLSAFDEIRALSPGFGESIRREIDNGPRAVGDPCVDITIDDVRTQLEEAPFPLYVVFGAVPVLDSE